MLKQAAEANVHDDEVEGSRMKLYMIYHPKQSNEHAELVQGTRGARRAVRVWGLGFRARVCRCCLRT